LNVITHLLGQIPYEPLAPRKIALPERTLHDDDHARRAPRYIPTPF
jgi:hypothetical protein